MIPLWRWCMFTEKVERLIQIAEIQYDLLAELDTFLSLRKMRLEALLEAAVERRKFFLERGERDKVETEDITVNVLAKELKDVTEKLERLKKMRETLFDLFSEWKPFSTTSMIEKRLEELEERIERLKREAQKY